MRERAGFFFPSFRIRSNLFFSHSSPQAWLTEAAAFLEGGVTSRNIFLSTVSVALFRRVFEIMIFSCRVGGRFFFWRATYWDALSSISIVSLRD